MRNSILITFVLLVLVPYGRCYAAIDLTPLRSLPVQDNGRTKPIDTFAIETVRFITGNTRFGSVVNAEDGQQITDALDPLALLVDWSVRPRDWERRPTLYVPLLELRGKLGMPQNNKWISPRTLRTNAANRLWTQELLARHEQAEKDGEETNFSRVEQADLDLHQRLQAFDAAASLTSVEVIPDPRAAYHWFSIFELSSPTPLVENSAAQSIPAAWQAMSDAYLASDADRFATTSQNLVNIVHQASGITVDREARVDREVFYNRVLPFRIVWIAYAFAVTAFIASNMSRRRFVYYVALSLFCVAIALHVGSYCLRCSITGWAPVTNMYETVIWVSMMAALVSLVLEIRCQRRTAGLAGAIVALLASIVADAMPPEYGSAIRNLTPVLRSNYWLVIHVLTIVSSYAAFALAMVLGDIVVFQFAVSKYGNAQKLLISADTIRTNLSFVYRSVQVGVLLVASGTILGGLWADVSWGRFWGWDPKEVWALIVLLTYLALLHGRFAGWIGQFGLAAGSVICFTTVLMSWYGVNFVLGTGLHAYGFGTGGQGYVFSFATAQWIYVAAMWLIYRRPLMERRSSIPTEAVSSTSLVPHAS